jgi:hypothetical protein
LATERGPACGNGAAAVGQPFFGAGGRLLGVERGVVRTRLALSAFALLCASTSAAAATTPELDRPPFGAQATTSLRINADDAYLVTFTVLRDMVHAESPLELISSVYRCANECEQVADQVDPLPASALKVASNGASATLRTRWLGVPLVITWKARSVRLSGEVLVVNDPTTQHQQIYQGAYRVLNASTVTSLYGRTCNAVDGALYKSDRGVAIDYPAGTSTPRADSVRAALAATRGRCFNQQ